MLRDITTSALVEAARDCGLVIGGPRPPAADAAKVLFDRVDALERDFPHIRTYIKIAVARMKESLEDKGASDEIMVECVMVLCGNLYLMFRALQLSAEEGREPSAYATDVIAQAEEVLKRRRKHG